MITINFETSNVTAALQDLKALGFKLIAQRPAPSWNGREPETLIVASCEGYSVNSRAIRKLAADHQQDCIAVLYPDGSGLCIGSKPVAFDINYFIKK
jgi:hypothetical protein